MIEVECPGGHRLNIDDRHAGKRVRCPKCSEALTVPNVDHELPSSTTDGRQSGGPPPFPSEGGKPPSLRPRPRFKSDDSEHGAKSVAATTRASKDSSTGRLIVVVAGLAGMTFALLVGGLIFANTFGWGIKSTSLTAADAPTKTSDDIAAKSSDSEAKVESSSSAAVEPTLSVVSTPPRNFRRGETFQYQVETTSTKPVGFDVIAAPKGTTVSDEGHVTWRVPVDFPDQKTSVTIRVRGDHGKELFHTFDLGLVQAIAQAPAFIPAANAVPAAEPPQKPVANKQPTPSSPSRRTNVELPLPGTVGQIVTAGSGRYLLATVPSSNQVVVIDVAARKIATAVPVDDSGALVAGGKDKFVVYLPSKGTMSRFDLATQTRELTVGSEAYGTIALGTASEGPIFALNQGGGPGQGHFPQPVLIDLQQLKPLNDVIKSRHPIHDTLGVSISSDGNAIAGWRLQGSPSGMYAFSRTGDEWTSAYEHNSSSPLSISPDGRFIYSTFGKYDITCRKRPEQNPARRSLSIPALSGPFYVQFEATPPGSANPNPLSMKVQSQSDDTTLLTISDIDLSPVSVTVNHNALPMTSRFFWMPELDAIAFVGGQTDKLVFYDFNLREELNKSSNNYLIVTSQPPDIFRRGTNYEYPIQFLSQSPQVELKLEQGPPGMAITGNGVVTWDVPDDFPAREFVAVIKLSSAGGRETIHTMKVSDGTPSVPEMAANPMPQRTVPPTVMPPSNPAVTINVAATPPKKVEAGHWTWTSQLPYFVRDEGAGLAGILVGNKLYRVSTNGLLQTEPVTMKSNYSQLAARTKSNYFVGVAANPTRLEIVGENGDLIRTVKLDEQKVTSLAIHPLKPISYVSLDKTAGVFRGMFVTVDEQKGTVKGDDEDLGQEIAVDPTGRFLITSYAQSFHVGEQIVVTQQQVMRGGAAPVPRRGRGAPLPGRPIPGRPVPGRPIPGRSVQVVPRIGIRQSFANVSLALVYDLDDPADATIHNVFPLKMPIGQLRLSHDGQRMISLSSNNSQTGFVACNPLHQQDAAVKFGVASASANPAQVADILFHPVLPVAVLAHAGKLEFLQTEDGKPADGKAEVGVPELANLSIVRVLVSSDAKFVNVVARNNAGEYTLLRKPIPLTNEERKLIEGRWLGRRDGLKESAPPLAELTAWRNDNSKEMSAAEITSSYTDAVVIVRSGNKSGTGFFVGDSGLILTCAHCVSPLDEIQVGYHPVGKPDDREMIEATIVRRDRKRDLCLLKVSADVPFHSVQLADPKAPQAGGNVTVISNPGLGDEILDNTVTTGVISSNNRALEGLNFIQTSAAVNHGSSGGPMFDSHGNVIGVVVLKAGIEGVGFAIPPDAIARFLLKVTRQDGKSGELVRNWRKADSTTLEKRRLLSVKAGSATLADVKGEKVTLELADFSAGDRTLLELIDADE